MTDSRKGSILVSYCTEAVSVEICHRIRDRERPPYNNKTSVLELST